jgi:hypothetical protein
MLDSDVLVAPLPHVGVSVFVNDDVLEVPVSFVLEFYLLLVLMPALEAAVGLVPRQIFGGTNCVQTS